MMGQVLGIVYRGIATYLIKKCRVQEMERTPSGCFPVVEIEHTAQPFVAMNRIFSWTDLAMWFQ